MNKRAPLIVPLAALVLSGVFGCLSGMVDGGFGNFFGAVTWALSVLAFVTFFAYAEEHKPDPGPTLKFVWPIFIIEATISTVTLNVAWLALGITSTLWALLFGFITVLAGKEVYQDWLRSVHDAQDDD